MPLTHTLTKGVRLASEKSAPFRGTSVAPTRLRELALDLGIDRVEVLHMASDAMLVPRPDRGYTVFLNSSQGRARHRFSLAHEISHVILEPLVQDVIRRRSPFCGDQDPEAQRLERICNVMAAEILMPAETFRDVAQQRGWQLNTALYLSSKLDVSVEATMRRLVDLAPEACAVLAWKGSEPDWLEWKWWHGNSSLKARWIGFAKGTSLSHYPSLKRAHESTEQIAGVEDIVIQQNSPKNSRSFIRKTTACESRAIGSGQFKRGYTLVFPERA